MREYQKDEINIPGLIAKRLLCFSIVMSILVAFISIMVSWAVE